MQMILSVSLVFLASFNSSLTPRLPAHDCVVSMIPSSKFRSCSILGMIRTPCRPFGHGCAWRRYPRSWLRSKRVANAARSFWYAKQAHTVLELLGDILVNGVTEVLDSALSAPQHDRRAVVGCLSSGLGVHSHQIELFPHDFHEFVDIEPQLGRDGNRVRDLAVSWAAGAHATEGGNGSRSPCTAGPVLRSKWRQSCSTP